MTKCCVASCTLPAKFKGFCNPHYIRNQRGKDMNAPVRSRGVVKICSVASCEKEVKCKGLCNGHYSRKRKGEELDTPFKRTGNAKCSFEGCNRPYFSQWLCRVHYRRQLRGEKMSLEITDRYPKQSGCDVAGCERRHAGQGFCAKHLSLHRRYLLTKDQIATLPTVCELCGSEKNLHIDHDHACCPTQFTCGKCVRGVLCQQCNHGLGNFKDNHDLLIKAAEWVKR